MGQGTAIRDAELQIGLIEKRARDAALFAADEQEQWPGQIGIVDGDAAGFVGRAGDCQSGPSEKVGGLGRRFGDGRREKLRRSRRGPRDNARRR